MENAIVVLKDKSLNSYVKKVKKFFNVLDVVLINEKTNKKGDIYICFGGDGTFLWTANLAKSKPVIGFNFGNLGFLSNFEFKDIDKVLRKIKEGKILPEKRSRIKILKHQVLNDIIINSQDGSLITFDITINNLKSIKFKGNGIIFSTSTGSTAANAYAGGPIVVPTLHCIIINAIVPYSFFVKPIVVDIDSKIVLKVHFDKKEPIIIIDGRFIGRVKKYSSLKIEKGDDAYVFSSSDVFYNISKKLRKIVF
jgi:NAD+ kinase